MNRCRTCGHCLIRANKGFCVEHEQLVRLNSVCRDHTGLVSQQRLFNAEHVALLFDAVPS